jgi:hypothetical protein
VCNLTDLELKNISFFIWNSSGLYNSTSKNISGKFSSGTKKVIKAK